jgi:hypothetical protein
MNSRQQALDNITAEELDKIKAHQADTNGALPVDNEWMILAEFAKAFGWQAYLDARDDKIDLAEMLTLVEANRKLEAGNHYRMAEAVLIGAGSAQSKKPAATFKSLVKDIIKRT